MVQASTQTQAAVAAYNKDAPAQALVIIRNAEVPRPGPKEVLVHINIRPINPSDIFCLQGVYGGFKPSKLPAVPGLEEPEQRAPRAGAGVVEQLGEGVTDWQEGERVTAVPWPSEHGQGTWQEYVTVKAEYLVRVPKEVSDEEAAQFLVNPVTAYGFLEDFKVPAGEYLLSNAANSVLGRELIQMAQRRGTKLINVVRRREVVAELHKLGAEEVVCTADEDLVARVMQITGGRGAWCAANPVGGPASKPINQCVRHGGTVYIYSMFGDEVIVPMYDLHFRSLHVRGFWVSVWLSTLTRTQRQAALQAVMDMIARREVLPPPPRKLFDLDEAPAAVEEAQKKSAGGLGKVMLVSYLV